MDLGETSALRRDTATQVTGEAGADEYEGLKREIEFAVLLQEKLNFKILQKLDRVHCIFGVLEDANQKYVKMQLLDNE